jgi:hypothetical protein
MIAPAVRPSAQGDALTDQGLVDETAKVAAHTLGLRNRDIRLTQAERPESYGGFCCAANNEAATPDAAALHA